MMMMISRKEKKLTLPNNAREAQAGFLLRGIELLPEPLVQLLRDRFGHGGADRYGRSVPDATGERWHSGRFSVRSSAGACDDAGD